MITKNIAIDSFFDSKEYSNSMPSKLKQNSVYRLTIMHGPKICNFNCPNYCYTEGLAEGNLNKDQLKDVIDQAKDIYAKTTYWPGLGELTLLKDFWDIMEYQANKNLPKSFY